MPTRNDELEAFKSRINLSAYAASQGYEIDRRASSRNSVGMRHPGGDKIIIGMGDDQHWIYFSVHDPADHGSIIDFVTNRQRVNLGEVRKELRPWLDGVGSFPTAPPASSFVERLEPVAKDLPAVRARLAAMQPVKGHHAYLMDERNISAALLLSEIFSGRVLIDDRNNIVFPHWNREGLCGYEIKNAGFTGFASGGVKGLFGSRKKEGDTKLVIAETALDALSYAVLFGLENTRFVSTAGTMNPAQPVLLRSAMNNMPTGSEIIAAVDCDEGGDAIAEQLEAIYDALRRPEIAFKRHSPTNHGEDWNDALRASMTQTEPTPGFD